MLRLLAGVVLAGGALVMIALLMGAADPASEHAIIVEFRSLGTQDSAAGFRIETDNGAYTILVTRDGYLSISAQDPDWRAFPHIAVQRNRLLLDPGEGERATVLYINGERAWQGITGVIQRCNIVARGNADVQWLVMQGCTGVGSGTENE